MAAILFVESIVFAFADVLNPMLKPNCYVLVTSLAFHIQRSAYSLICMYMV